MEPLESGVNKTLKRVVVIDDAYAPADPTDLDGDAHSRFANALLDDAKRVTLVKKEFKLESLDPSIPQHIEQLAQNREIVRKLWSLRERKAWTWLVDSLFRTYAEEVAHKQNDLAELEQLLSKYRWKVDKFSTFDTTTVDLTAYEVIFLDFYLKGEDGAESSLQRAAETAKRIVEARTAEKLPQYPFVVLMSSRPGASERQDEFKLKTGLRADFFCFIKKAEIMQHIETKFGELLKDYAGKQALAHLLDEYWLAAIRSAATLRQHLAMVEPSELALLHEAELAVEGAGLPDYLSWLTSEALASGLLEDPKVRSLGTRLPQILGHSAFPGAVPPSSRIAAMYVRSVMRLDISDEVPETKASPVELGDLFARIGAAGEPSEFLLVVDQSCDLARPDSTRKTNVLCLRSRAQELSDVALAFYRNAQHLPDSVMADLVGMKVGEVHKYYLAKWELINPVTPTLADLCERKGSLKRLARLKPISALARQEGLTQRVGRIGEPVAPPSVVAYRAKVVLSGKPDKDGNQFKRDFDASKEPWAAAIVVQGRHMPKPEPATDVGSEAAQPKKKSSNSIKTSTTMSLTSDFGEWLLGKLDRAKLEDNQAKTQGEMLANNLKAQAVQRISLESGQGDTGLMQVHRKAHLPKPKLTIQVVFDKAVPAEFKNEPIVLLLTPYDQL